MNIKPILKKLINILLCLFIITTVLPVKLNYSSIIIIVLVGCSLLNLIIDKEARQYYLFLLSIPFFIYILGLINTDNLDYGLKVISKNLSLVAFPLIFFSNNNKGQIQVNKILQAFLLALVIVDIYLIYLFVYYYNIGEKFSMIVTDTLYHSTYLGLYNLVAAWVCIYRFRAQKDKRFIIWVLFFLIAGVLTSSRIIFGLAIISIFITTVLLLNSKITKSIIFLTIVLLSIFSVLKVPSLNEKFSQLIEIEKWGFDKDNYQSISSRFGKIEASLKLIEKNPLFGVGTGDLIDELVSEYKEMGFVMGYKYRYNPHNQFLDSLARNGLIGGGICLFIFFVAPFILAVKQKNGLLIAVILLAVIISSTESIFGLQKGITFYSFFITLLVSNILQKLKHEHSTN
jgi:O-antigen ligase